MISWFIVNVFDVLKNKKLYANLKTYTFAWIFFSYIVSAKCIEIVKKLHESFRQQIEKKNEQYAFKTNKDSRRVIFKPSDWV
jgi:hypothetical protein